MRSPLKTHTSNRTISKSILRRSDPLSRSIFAYSCIDLAVTRRKQGHLFVHRDLNNEHSGFCCGTFLVASVPSPSMGGFHLVLPTWMAFFFSWRGNNSPVGILIRWQIRVVNIIINDLNCSAMFQCDSGLDLVTDSDFSSARKVTD